MNVDKRTISVHISFDDVILIFDEMKRGNYKSVFQYRIFKRLKWFHKKYGCKFTLYVFVEFSDKYLCEIPYKYRKELVDNSDWIKWGYHGYSPKMLKGQFKEGYKIFRKLLVENLGESCESHIVRLHSFCANRDQLIFMKNSGVDSFLTSDDNRLSYDLSEIENRILADKGSYKREIDNFYYFKTMVRLEAFSLFKILKFDERKRQVIIFTHEKYLLNKFFSKELFKLWIILCILNHRYDITYFN